VNIFFTLSGFLITYILASEWQRTGGIDFRRFYRHRAVRLFPALALVIAAHVAYAAHQGAAQFRRTVSDLPPVVLYFGNWVRAFSHSEYALGGLGHTWSLSVEEQFYVVWPLIVAFMRETVGVARRPGSRPRRLCCLPGAAHPAVA
jgi:peptidoglycan/LPS O-acetylase OafA/YrhL